MLLITPRILRGSGKTTLKRWAGWAAWKVFCADGKSARKTPCVHHFGHVSKVTVFGFVFPLTLLASVVPAPSINGFNHVVGVNKMVRRFLPKWQKRLKASATLAVWTRVQTDGKRRFWWLPARGKPKEKQTKETSNEQRSTFNDQRSTGGPQT